MFHVQAISLKLWINCLKTTSSYNDVPILQDEDGVPVINYCEPTFKDMACIFRLQLKLPCFPHFVNMVKADRNWTNIPNISTNNTKTWILFQYPSLQVPWFYYWVVLAILPTTCKLIFVKRPKGHNANLNSC